MDNWDEIRTAYQVARVGTVSGAAEVLGVHHATVIRHIDALEERLGTRLFQRHARGYTPTEAGQDLMQVAATTDDQLTQLAGRIKGQGEGVSGELVVTSLEAFSPELTPVLASFRATYPEISIRYLTGQRLFRLEYGEAHVAIRAGKAPDQPDNVVQKFRRQSAHLVAARDYIAQHGQPGDEDDLAGHWFVGPEDKASRAPYNQWLAGAVPEDRVIFRTSTARNNVDAILSGVGIGFVGLGELERHPDLVEVLPSQQEWGGQLWLVTHVDLHRTTKVQAFLKHLKDWARDAQD
ncbi:LysR family transcriptional regulator [Salibaculum sp.]|uniref:LysR family transcriptional regulator n=1 Tax=Salibaculum sp. TaxID=2855480 RepID=UPI002B48DAF5|nr:LysR family transcriptional regulator [Salibaculum sp.]HKL70153.1 LysR family transcriptional regulator [Salibaculum sp.]